MKIAWLFPGQGSQYIGMGQGLFELSGSAKEIFDEAEVISGLPLRELSVNGPAERLRDWNRYSLQYRFRTPLFCNSRECIPRAWRDTAQAKSRRSIAQRSLACATR